MLVVTGGVRDGVDVQRSVYEDGLCIMMYNVCLVCDNVQDASLLARATSRANSSDSEAPPTRIGIFLTPMRMKSLCMLAFTMLTTC